MNIIMCPVDKDLMYIIKKYQITPCKTLIKSKNITIIPFFCNSINFIFHQFRIGNETFKIIFKSYGDYLIIHEIISITNRLIYDETAFFTEHNKSLIFNKINKYLNIFIKNRLNCEVKKLIYKEII